MTTYWLKISLEQRELEHKRARLNNKSQSVSSAETFVFKQITYKKKSSYEVIKLVKFSKNGAH